MEEEKKIYIGNLDYNVTDSDLTEMLGTKGIKAKGVTIIIDKYSGKSKGFGFAEFETKEEAQQAIEALNNIEVGGRALKVNMARKMEPRKNNFGGGSQRRDSFNDGGNHRGGRY